MSDYPPNPFPEEGTPSPIDLSKSEPTSLDPYSVPAAPAYGAPSTEVPHPQAPAGYAPPQPPPPPNYYGHQQYQPAPTNDSSLMVLLLGLGGLFIPLVSFVAWYLGGKERKASRLASRPDEPMTTIGWLLGIFASVLQVLFFAFFMLAFILMIFTGVSTEVA